MTLCSRPISENKVLFNSPKQYTCWDPVLHSHQDPLTPNKDPVRAVQKPAG